MTRESLLPRSLSISSIVRQEVLGCRVSPALFSLEGTNVPRDSTHRAFDREDARRLSFFENCIEKNFQVSRERHRESGHAARRGAILR